MATVAVMTARRTVAAEAARASRTDALLHTGIAWSGVVSTGIGLSWVAGWSPGLDPYAIAAQFLGVALAVLGLGVAYGAARRRTLLRRWAALGAASVMTTAAVIIVATTGNLTGAITYVGVAGLHLVWAMRSA